MRSDVAAAIASAYTAVKYAAERSMSTLDALIADARERQERGDSSWHVVADKLEEDGREEDAAKLRQAVAKGHSVQVAADGSFHVADGQWRYGHNEHDGLRHFTLLDGGPGGNPMHRVARHDETLDDVIEEFANGSVYDETPGWVNDVSEIDEDGDTVDSQRWTAPESRAVE